MESKVKFLFLLFVPYSFFCAGIYHIAYWSLFDLNGLALIDSVELIKSCIYPLLYSSISFIFAQLLIELFLSIRSAGSEQSGKYLTLSEKFKSRVKWIGYAYIVIVIVITIFHDDGFERGIDLAFAYWPGVTALTIMFLNSIIGIPRKFLVSLAIMLSTLPMMSFISGRMNAFYIQSNWEYSYTINTENGDTLKYLGQSGDAYMFTDLTNSKNVIITRDQRPVLELIKVKR